MSAKRTSLPLAFALLLGLAQAVLPAFSPADALAAPWPVKGKVVSYANVSDRLGSGHVVYTEERRDEHTDGSISSTRLSTPTALPGNRAVKLSGPSTTASRTASMRTPKGASRQGRP